MLGVRPAITNQRRYRNAVAALYRTIFEHRQRLEKIMGTNAAAAGAVLSLLNRWRRPAVRSLALSKPGASRQARRARTKRFMAGLRECELELAAYRRGV